MSFGGGMSTATIASGPAATMMRTLEPNAFFIHYWLLLNYSSLILMLLCTIFSPALPQSKKLVPYIPLLKIVVTCLWKHYTKTEVGAGLELKAVY
jgi:hypothetical protein